MPTAIDGSGDRRLQCGVRGIATGGAAIITTARNGIGDDGWRTQPHAGGVYRASVAGAIGLPEARFDDR